MWKTRHIHKVEKKKKKGPVEPDQEEEEELETFFCRLYDFHNPPVPVPVPATPLFPPRYVINFVPAAPSVISSPVISSPVISPTTAVSPTAPVIPPPTVPFPAISADIPASPVATDYSVISSVNFDVSGSIVTSPSTCIETT